MAPTRDSQGRIKTPERFASPEFRAHALALQRAGSSIRAIAAETGRSKTALARDIALAREEERAARETQRASTKPERKPGASVLLLDGAGRLTRPDGSVVASPRFLLPKPHYREGQEAMLERHEHDALVRAAFDRAGLSEWGMATVATPPPVSSTIAYDPADPTDVARVRRLVREDWRRHRLAEGDDEVVAAAVADEVAREWTPHPGLR